METDQYEKTASLFVLKSSSPWSLDSTLSLPLSLSLPTSMSPVSAKNDGQEEAREEKRQKESRVAITTNCIVTRKLRDYSVRANHAIHVSSVVEREKWEKEQETLSEYNGDEEKEREREKVSSRGAHTTTVYTFRLQLARSLRAQIACVVEFSLLGLVLRGRHDAFQVPTLRGTNPHHSHKHRWKNLNPFSQTNVIWYLSQLRIKVLGELKAEIVLLGLFKIHD